MSVFLLAMTIIGCDPPEPVLSGIPEAPLLKEADDSTPRTDREPEPYEKPGNVQVDVRYLCGQPLESIRTELIEQLGPRQNVRILDATRGREVQYTRGRIRVLNGVIYMVSVPLNEPMYRRVALEKTGFPPFSGSVIRLSGEYRINNQWDFRRIRMTRVARDAEMVNEVEAWRWLPRERQ